MVSITLSLPTFCINFTILRRKWRRLFAHPQRFFRGISDRFLQTEDFQPTASHESFLYLSVTEFKALQALAKEDSHRPTLNTPLNPHETINIITKPTNNLPAHSFVSTHAPNFPQRFYSKISAPTYSAPST